MSALDLKHLTVKEKLILIEEIWEDLSKNDCDMQLTPAWHLDILNERELKVQNNETQFEPLEVVKNQLRELF